MVSIVLPVYNSEKYLKNCLDSILAQTFQDFEVIIVNDGSTDSSLDICKKYESDRFKVFTIKNCGAPKARNFGITMCSHESEALFFVDSDDLLSPYFLDSLLKHHRNGVFTFCDLIEFSEETVIHDFPIDNLIPIDLSDGFRDENFLKLMKIGRLNQLTNKCYDFSIIRENCLTIPEDYPEDIRFNLLYLNFCNKITYLPHKLYFYRKGGSSITSKAYESIYREYIKIQVELYKKVPPVFHSYVGEFVYYQYLGNTRKYLREGDKLTPRKYLKHPLIRRAIREHKSTCMGDAWIKMCLRFGLLDKLI